MTMTKHAVVIAGGGPTGLMLAGELALLGIDVAIVERRASQDLPGSRAGGLHARTIEVLDQRGVADRFLSQGQVAQVAGFAWIRLDISDFPTRHPYGLALWQNRIEEILAGWIAELGVPIRRGVEVTGFVQDDAGVEVALSDGGSLRATYLVGCDGGRSRIRKAAGIEFSGWGPTSSNLIGEVELTEEPEYGLRRDELGIHSLGPLEDGTVRVLVREDGLGGSEEPTLDDLSRALVSARGTDYGLRRASWLSRFTDVTRQAVTYRDGRDLLAGDAAHIHPPVGGQGLNIGMQGAGNLGWKLAQDLRGVAPDGLLDTNTAERNALAAAGCTACSTPTRPSGIPSRPGCSAAPWRRHRSSAVSTSASRRSARCSPSCWRWTSRAGGSPAGSPASTSGTTSARGTRCSGAGCRTSSWPPPTVLCGSTSCSTTPGRCSSISGSRLAWTPARGPIASSSSVPRTAARGSCRCSAPFPRRAPSSCDRTGMSPGSATTEMGATMGWPTRSPGGAGQSA